MTNSVPDTPASAQQSLSPEVAALIATLGSGPVVAAYVAYLATLAATDPAWWPAGAHAPGPPPASAYVFRRDYLGGRLLAPQDAVELLRTPAAANLPVGRLRELGALPIQDVPSFALVTMLAEQQLQNEVMRTEGAPSVSLRSGDGVIHTFPAAPGSLLHALGQLGVELAAAYAWDEAAAASFVLTGLVPDVHPLQVAVEAAGRPPRRAVLHLRFEAWVPALALLPLIRALQQHVLGQDNRPIAERTLALFSFVMTQRDGHYRLPPWSVLLTEWNSDPSRWGQPAPDADWRFRDVRLFIRAYRRAEHELLGYSPPGRRGRQPIREGDDHGATF